MSHEALRGRIQYLGLVHGVTRRVIESFPEAKLDWSPAPGSRTPREVIAHIYGSAAAHAEAGLKGTLTKEDHDRHEGAPRGGTAELVSWCDRKFAEFVRDVQAATDAQLDATVKCFYGDFTGAQLIDFSYDEHWHHRGQLTVYLRLLGISVPFLYDYAA